REWRDVSGCGRRGGGEAPTHQGKDATQMRHQWYHQRACESSTATRGLARPTVLQTPWGFFILSLKAMAYALRDHDTRQARALATSHPRQPTPSQQPTPEGLDRAPTGRLRCYQGPTAQLKGTLPRQAPPRRSGSAARAAASASRSTAL